MDPGSRLLASQTQLEQRDLIQYECNLAACYEAEYLLSLKIQEEMCHQKDAYDDPSEVTCPQFNHPATGTTHSVMNGTAHFPQEAAMNFSNGDRAVGQVLTGFLNSSESGHSRFIRAEHLAGNACGQEQPGHFSHESVGTGMDSGQLSSRDECGAGEDHLMHHDGPSRKKMCLNRPEY